MHPALALAKRKLEEARKEFDELALMESDIVPVIAGQSSPVASKAKVALRATMIGGVYTGIEGILKEVLSVVDGGVLAEEASWHAQLLAQAAAPNEESGRDAILSDAVYGLLDELRAFRHIERNLYRHLYRDQDVEDNLNRLKEVFPLFEAEVEAFLNSWAPIQHEGRGAP